MEKDEPSFYNRYYTAVCSDGHAIVMHEPCESMVLHEASLRLDYVMKVVEIHERACRLVTSSSSQTV